MDLNKLAPEAHRIAVEHGFWAYPYTAGGSLHTLAVPTKLALMCTELGEALVVPSDDWRTLLEELSDYVIRAADLIGQIGPVPTEALPMTTVKLPRSLSYREALFYMTIEAIQAHRKGQGNEAVCGWVARACDFIEGWFPSILDYVQAKMVKNETRPYKHDRQY